MKKFEWECQECGSVNPVCENELENNVEHNCCYCGSLHIVELMVGDGLNVEIY